MFYRKFTENFTKAFGALSDRDKLIIVFRSDGMTLDQVGEIFGITNNRVRQLENKAVARLYKHLHQLS